MNVLDVRGITVGYGDLIVLRDVSFSVKEGEFVSLVGRNGAGKTTLLKAISGALPMAAGDVDVLGANVSQTPPHGWAEIGMAHVPENRHIFTQMTVEENLRMGAYCRRAARDFDSNLERVFTIFPLLKVRRRQKAGSLSGGQQQMLTIARGMMSSPRLMILDEPLLGLSPRSSSEVCDAISTINSIGVTVLLVEQNISGALALSQRGIVLEGGRIVKEGDSRALRDDPHIVSAYLGVNVHDS